MRATSVRTFAEGAALSRIAITMGALLLASCSQEQEKPLDYHLLATDIHVIVGDHSLVLPLVAISQYTLEGTSRRLDWQTDDQREIAERNDFIRRSETPATALTLDQISVGIGAYGWSDTDTQSHELCPRLTRSWSKSLCDNPWTALAQALPANRRFYLIDLRRLALMTGSNGLNCADDVAPKTRHEPFLAPRLFCETKVFGSGETKFYTAVVKIDGNLGVQWTVWEGPDRDETASQMAAREGKAIQAFTQDALGPNEDFPRLHDTACSLRRPRSEEGVYGSGCLRGKPIEVTR